MLAKPCQRADPYRTASVCSMLPAVVWVPTPVPSLPLVDQSTDRSTSCLTKPAARSVHRRYRRRRTVADTSCPTERARADSGNREQDLSASRVDGGNPGAPPGQGGARRPPIAQLTDTLCPAEGFV